MTSTPSRLEQRIRRDFPEPGSAHGVLLLLSDLPRKVGYDPEILASERIQAAVVLLAHGDLARLRRAVDLAATDWRDLLVAAGLADEDWPARLDRELGPTPLRRSGREFATLGFSPDYTCELDPELPGDGRWGCPVYRFRRDGIAAGELFRSRWGTPLIARFTPVGHSTWTGMFEAGGSGGIDGAFACPAPSAALAVCEGQAYLVDVHHPDATMILPGPVTQVTSAGSDLIALASFDGLTVIGRRGQAWASERLCLDSLKIVNASAASIECLGDFPDGVEAFTVAASTGELLEGRHFRDTWPGP